MQSCCSCLYKHRTMSLCLLFAFILASTSSSWTQAASSSPKATSKNAYATMLYMGTPRDRDFYIAARVMLRSLARLNVDADLVIIASKDLPVKWIKTLHNEGIRVVSVDNIQNPYSNQANFDNRFRLTLNKLYAWSLIEYERVVMLDADNLFVQKTDELFQCGQFCAAFINPCIFHTGLFVLEPSTETFQDLLHGLKTRQNDDGADQGYLMAYFNDLLDRPLFHPPANSSKLNGHYRLPLGYQMDASYYYLKLRWNVPCGPNSVITFPSMPWLKPWYWWSWPVLPLGLAWHEKRMLTIGYGSEITLLLSEAIFYIVTMGVAIFIQKTFSQSEKLQAGKICAGKGICSSEFSFLYPFLKALSLLGIIVSFLLPFILAPRMIHPFMGWALLLLGSLCLLVINIIVFHLPTIPVLTPWLGILGALLVLSFPFYSNGIVRALSIAAYAFFASPFLWWAAREILGSINQNIDRESVRWTTTRSTEQQQSELMKLC